MGGGVTWQSRWHPLLTYGLFSGELSEGQKQEVEKFREMVSHKEREVIEMRQQLAKLSRIIDKQKEELKAMEVELR